MSKNYQVVNSNSKNYDCTIYYIFYIILIFIIIYLFSRSFFLTYWENFASESSTPTSENSIKNLITQNEELNQIKTVLQEKLVQQSRAIYLSDNYEKIVEDSFNDEVNFLNLEFDNIILPEINVENYVLVESENQLQGMINQAQGFVNIYKPGDIVYNNSTFGIDKNTICYPDLKKDQEMDPDFLKNYPNCMVCNINNPYSETKSWHNTKTNIDKVCLFNYNAEQNSGIPTLEQCQSLCEI